jgi:hypothetical protein
MVLFNYPVVSVTVHEVKFSLTVIDIAYFCVIISKAVAIKENLCRTYV